MMNRVYDEMETPESVSNKPVAIPRAVNTVKEATIMMRDNFL